jgi:hypothetical protein
MVLGSRGVVARSIGLILVISGLVCAYALFRVARSRLVVADGGVSVVTEWESRFVAWSDVGEFFVPASESMVYIRTKSEGDVRVPPLSGKRPSLFRGARTPIVRIADQLNARLDSEQTRHRRA